MIGPTQADAAQQVRAVEDLIARKVDVIAVVPNDAKALEPVFKRAQEAGIKVLTHESPDQKYNDWNIELTSAQGFGEEHMEALAKAMGGKGKYIVYVGSLTVPLHNKWADSAIAYQKAKYPKMQLVADRFGVAESMDDSYKTALDQMRANPTSRASWRSAARVRSAPRGRSRRRARPRSIAVVGPFSPGRARSTSSPAPSAKASSGTRCWPARSSSAWATCWPRASSRPTAWTCPASARWRSTAKARSILAAKLEAIDKDTIDGLAAMGL